MKTVKDRAIILRKQPFGEADVILTLYTEKNGKVRAIAKGARKITSKLLGFTESFTIIACQIDFRPNLPIISQVSHEQLFEGIAENRQLYEQLHTVAELIDRGVHEREADSALFRVLKEGVSSLVASDHPLVLAHLVLRIAGMLGFEPELYRCAHCEESLESADMLGWGHLAGGVVKRDHVADTFLLTTDEVKVLRFLRTAHEQNITKLQVPVSLGRRLETLILDYVQFVLETSFVSQRVTRERS